MPTTTTAVRADAIAAATPGDRNRFADAVRVVALLVVVVGHWLLAVVTVDTSGGVEGSTLLREEPWTQWLTWVFQVMPVFFFVGGYAHAASWSGARRRGEDFGAWVGARAGRLLWPTVPLIVGWGAAAPLLAAAGVAAAEVTRATQLVLVPLWFLAVYLLVVLLAPLAVGAQQRFGWWCVVALVGTAIAVDIARYAADVPVVGWSNFLWVWGAMHQLGVAWHAGAIGRDRRVLAALALGGLAALVVLTTAAGYPVSMVGVDDGARTNNTPPSLALAALGAAQVGVLLLARAPVDAWLRRPRVWAAVVRAGAVAMSLYLWHLTALVVVVAVLRPPWLLRPVDATWWLMRPVWFALLATALAALVAAVRRFEHRPRARARDAAVTRLRPVAAVLGATAVSAGIAVAIRDGLHQPGAPLGVAVVPLAFYGAGLAVLLPQSRRHPGGGPGDGVRRS